MLMQIKLFYPQAVEFRHSTIETDSPFHINTKEWWIPFMDQVMTIGRTPYNEVVLPLPNISGVHARLYRCHQQLYIEDMKSTNGTYLNGFPLSRGNLRLIRQGDRVQIAGYPIQFHLYPCPNLRLLQVKAPNNASSSKGSNEGSEFT